MLASQQHASHVTGPEGFASREVYIQMGLHLGGGICIQGGVCIQGRPHPGGVCILGRGSASWEGGLHPGKGVCLQGGLHLGAGGLADPPWDTTQYGQQEGGSHSTVMHSCLNQNSSNSTNEMTNSQIPNTCLKPDV